ncbi:MAG: hypothetical protein LBL09_05015 [Oscillospiraceae bacterium]|jgi:hypothetical protein|nr:hypothetical protein [Oscillospiraceae bacterium]
MTALELSEKLGLEILKPGEAGREVDSCYIGDLLSWVMGRAKPGCAWITIMTNINVAAVASLADVSCVILAEGVSPDEALAGKLSGIDAAVFRTSMTAYELAGKIHGLIG